jgi:hypothetical protein
MHGRARPLQAATSYRPEQRGALLAAQDALFGRMHEILEAREGIMNTLQANFPSAQTEHKNAPLYVQARALLPSMLFFLFSFVCCAAEHASPLVLLRSGQACALCCGACNRACCAAEWASLRAVLRSGQACVLCCAACEPARSAYTAVSMWHCCRERGFRMRAVRCCNKL